MAPLQVLMVLPFVVLLALMALGPLLFAEWWGRHYPTLCGALGLSVIVYYVIGMHESERVFETLLDYLRFICLIGSLFIVSGGIHVTVEGEATPWLNVLFLLAGALVANAIGTTGASMLLIRPWLRMNRYRVTGHHVVFFIFVVSNVGGALTPIGDPPLYLGYLKGVPFWWVAQNCWSIWCVGVGLLLAAFYILDRRNYLRAPEGVRERLAESGDHWRFTGLRNLAFLGLILGATFMDRPLLLRELIMVAAAVGSYCTTQRSVHESNHFSFGPIREVAILFAAIFLTMSPALDWLRANAANIGKPTPGIYFAGTGALSSVLDNAPTYLAFLGIILSTSLDVDLLHQAQQFIQNHGAGLATITGTHADLVRQVVSTFVQSHPSALLHGRASLEEVGICFLLGSPASGKLIAALSIGAVFFGANTYIGNGPNLMVKAIADHQNVHTPSFFGYVIYYALPYMVPMLGIVWWVFFRS